MSTNTLALHPPAQDVTTLLYAALWRLVHDELTKAAWTQAREALGAAETHERGQR